MRQKLPSPVTGKWIHTAFTSENMRERGASGWRYIDRRDGEPYCPLLADGGKTLVILSPRGGYHYGYRQDDRPGDRNHVQASISAAFGYVGVTDVYEAAIEYEEFADNRLIDAIRQAQVIVDELVSRLGNRSA